MDEMLYDLSMLIAQQPLKVFLDEEKYWLLIYIDFNCNCEILINIKSAFISYIFLKLFIEI